MPTLQELIANKKAQMEAKANATNTETNTQNNTATNVNVEVKQETKQATQQEAKTEIKEEKTMTEQVQNHGSEETYEQQQKSYTDNLDVTKFTGVAESKFVKPLIDVDMYNAELVKIDRRKCHNNKTGIDEEKYIWNFKIISDMAGNQIIQDKNGKIFDKGIILSLFTSLAYGPKSKNFQVYTAIMKKQPELGLKYNLLECVGKKCRLTTKNSEPKAGNPPFTFIEAVYEAK